MFPPEHRLDTFTSFSRDKNAAYYFAGNDGCVLELDMSKDDDIIADVSWISKFPDEQEFLARRTFIIKIDETRIRWEHMKNGTKVQIVPCWCGGSAIDPVPR